jgi:chorismate mutase
MGFNTVPLLCTQEMAVPGSMARVVRLLMHFHAAEDHSTQHVYLHEARSLRTDLESAQ